MRPAPGLLLAAIAVTLLVLVPAGGAAAPTARASAPLHLTAPPSGGTAPRPVAGVAATVPTTGAAPWTAPSADAVCQGDIDRAGGACTAARLAEFRRSTGGASGWTPALPSNESPPAPADYGFQLVYDSADGMVLLYGQSAGVYGGFGGTEFWGFVHGTWTNLSATDPPPYCAGSALSYDPWDGYVVYFAASDSGFEDCAIAGQTWTYVGGTWTELYPSVAPPARWGAGFANDSADGYLVLFGGENETRAFNDTWTFYGGTWTNRTPVRSPSPREDPGMTYDAADGYLVLYGGDGGLRDTWQYLHGTWTDLNLSYSPPVPYPDGFAYDPVDGYAVYTNSYVYNASRYDEITWEFSGGAWHSLAPSGGLTDRPGAEQAFDYADGYLLFFGGIGPQYTPTAESWSFVGDAWTNRTDAPPAPLTGAAITDDPLDGVLLQFGGYNASGIQAETREYRDGVWTPIAPATSPPARYDAGLATDLHDGYVLLFGGIGVAGPLNDTWEFAGGDWLKLTPSTAPSPRVGTGLVYDGADGNVLLFGGAAGPLAGYDPGGYRDTWSFQGGVWKNLTAAVGPAPPSFPVNPLVYDALDGYVLDVGAYASTTPGLQQVLPVTWSYVGGVWTNRTTTPAPLGGPGAAVGYDSALSEVVLFGGFNGTGSGGPGGNNETWEYDNGSWAELFPSVSPPSQAGAVLVDDPLDGALYLGGAASAADPSGAWLWLGGGLRPLITGFSGSPPTVDVGNSTTLTVHASEGTATLSYRYSGLPVGCTSANVSALSCTPTVVGNYTVEVTVTDPAGNASFAGVVLTVVPVPYVGTFNASPSTVGIGGRVVLTATVDDGTAPYSFAYSGLPPGCASQTVPALPCTPSTAGNYTVVVTVTDAFDRSASAGTNVTVDPVGTTGAPLVRSFDASPDALVLGNATNLSVVATSSALPLSYGYSGLPPGCASANTSTLACRPTSAGVYPIEATVTDPGGNATSASTELTVFPAGGGGSLFVSAFGPSRPTTAVNESVTLRVVASDTTALTYSYAGLPPGCTSVDAPDLTCVPRAPGLYRVTVTVSDGAGHTVHVPLELEIVAGVSGTLVLVQFQPEPVRLDLGGTTVFFANVSGGSPPLTFAYSGLPTGCPGADAPVLPCTPTVAGTFDVGIVVSDAGGDRINATTVLTVVGPSPAATTSLGGTTGAEIALGAAALAVTVGLLGYWAGRRRPGAPPPS